MFVQSSLYLSGCVHRGQGAVCKRDVRLMRMMQSKQSSEFSEEEERRRAERAKRFAPRAASFEACRHDASHVMRVIDLQQLQAEAKAWHL